MVCPEHSYVLSMYLNVLSQLTLCQRDIILPKDLVWYWYDTPVLIIAITWHENKAKFGRFLYDKLSMSYTTNGATVCLLNV